jgi:hypothetical protein
MKEVCRTANLEISWGYVKQTRVCRCDRWSGRLRHMASSGVVDEEAVMSQQSVRQAARRSALDAQAVLRKARADRERRLEGLAVTVLTALGERNASIRDAEKRAGVALVAMTDEEGLSVREAVDWCGSGVTAREVIRLRRLAQRPGDVVDEPTS